MKLLKDILEAWKAEVEKKPPSMSVEEAYETLHLQKGVGGHDEAKIRKAYFRLAQKYHPDKNPDGRVSCQIICMVALLLVAPPVKRRTTCPLSLVSVHQYACFSYLHVFSLCVLSTRCDKYIVYCFIHDRIYLKRWTKLTNSYAANPN